MSDDVGLKVSTLNGIHSLITDAPRSVIEHVSTLVPRLLKLACDPASMVRTIVWIVTIASMLYLYRRYALVPCLVLEA